MNKITIFLLSTLLITACSKEPTEKKNTPLKLSIEFNETQFFHRWAANHQHEFTPKSQEDLSKWEDMLTINVYPHVTEGEGLAMISNTIMGNYQSANAMILKTDSVPRTKSKQAEHLMAVIFPRPEFIEVAFTRLKIIDGIGISTVYSHRVYGEKVGDTMSEWLKNNGSRIEKLLMQLAIPFDLKEL